MTQESPTRESQEATIRAQRRTIEELETPVIQIWERVLGVPIIGSLDTARTQRMNERLLDKIVSSGSEIVIIDITGVPIMDSAVAKHLLETVTAARLLGAEVLLVGMSTTVAITLVHLGLDLSDILTRTTMAKGLEHAFGRLGLHVLPMDGNPKRERREEDN